MNGNIILPTQYQITGDFMTPRLVSKDYQAAQVTDFALLLGTYKNPKTGSGVYWANTDYSYGMARGANIINHKGQKQKISCNNRGVGIRPSLLLSTVPMPEIKENNGIKEVEYGEYPQTIVDSKLAQELENELSFGSLNKTGKTYTTDSNDFRFTSKLKPTVYEEYEYNGNKYIRVVYHAVDDVYNSDYIMGMYTDGKLSNGQQLENGHGYWVKVEPIKWILSEDEQMITTKNIIVGNVKIGLRKYFYGYEEDTILRKFLDNYLVKDIISKKDYLNSHQEQFENKISGLENKRAVVLDSQKAINIKKQELENLKKQLINAYDEMKITDKQLDQLFNTISKQEERLNDKEIELNGSQQVLDSILGNDESQGKKIS